MNDEQKERACIIQGHFADINSRIAQVDEVIGKLVSEYEGAISLLCTIPGIDRRLAITIISEIGTEFGSSNRLCNLLRLFLNDYLLCRFHTTLHIISIKFYYRYLFNVIAFSVANQKRKESIYNKNNWDFYSYYTHSESKSINRAQFNMQEMTVNYPEKINNIQMCTEYNE